MSMGAVVWVKAQMVDSEKPDPVLVQWRDDFCKQWREFAAKYQLTTRSMHVVARDTNIAIKDYDRLLLDFEHYQQQSLLVGYDTWHLRWAKNNIDRWCQFRQKDDGAPLSFDDWLQAVRNGQFRLSLMRNTGPKTEAEILRAIQTEFTSDVRFSEYGYA
jgi:hypothetical protein